jgi:hypothetical protein
MLLSIFDAEPPIIIFYQVKTEAQFMRRESKTEKSGIRSNIAAKRRNGTIDKKACL